MNYNPEIFQDKLGLKRTAWHDLPPVIIHAPQSVVKKHPLYPRAKEGDAAAAEDLVLECVAEDQLQVIRQTCADTAVLLPVHALESEGMNVIPRVFAHILAKQLNLSIGRGVIQSNTVSHTSASGYHRLAFPALFEGEIYEERYFLVDDFVGQGGTLANLKGFIESNGGLVTGTTTLTGRADSAQISLTRQTLEALRSRHGGQLEEWWTDTFGYGLEYLTESEARYLIRVESFIAIRERLADARRAGNRRSSG